MKLILGRRKRSLDLSQPLLRHAGLQLRVVPPFQDLLRVVVETHRFELQRYDSPPERLISKG